MRMRLSRRGAVSVVAAVAVSVSAGSASAVDRQPSNRPHAKPVTFAAGFRKLPGRVAAGAKFTVDPRATTLPKGDAVTAVTINFGDGARIKPVKKLSPVTHAYGKPGTFTITLTVTDRHRKTVRTSKRVTSYRTGTAATGAPAVGHVLPGLLRGRVTFHGAGVPGLSVVANAFYEGYAPTPRQRPGQFRATTDRYGYWSFPDAGMAAYDLYFGLDPDTDRVTTTLYSVGLDSARVDTMGGATVDTALVGPVVLTGTVSGPQGPVTGGSALITQYFGDNHFIESSGPIGGDGRYIVTGLSDGFSTQAAFTPSDATVRPGGDGLLTTGYGGMTEILNESLAGAAVIRGVVAATKNPLTEPLDVEAVPVQADGERRVDLASSFVSASNGTFVAPQLPPGSYQIAVNYTNKATAIDANHSFVFTKTLSVAAGQTVDAGTLALASAASVSGQVTDPSGPVSFSLVSLMTADGVLIDAFSDFQGNFSLGRVPPGTYTLAATGASGENTESGSRPAVMVGDGQLVTGQNIVLTPKAPLPS